LITLTVRNFRITPPIRYGRLGFEGSIIQTYVSASVHSINVLRAFDGATEKACLTHISTTLSQV